MRSSSSCFSDRRSHSLALAFAFAFALFFDTIFRSQPLVGQRQGHGQGNGCFASQQLVKITAPHSQKEFGTHAKQFILLLRQEKSFPCPCLCLCLCPIF